MALNVLKSVFSALNNVQHFIKWRRVAVTVSVLCRISQKTPLGKTNLVCLSQAMHINFHKVCVYFTIRKIWNETLYLLPKCVKTTFWGKEFISYVEPLFIILLICF